MNRYRLRDRLAGAFAVLTSSAPPTPEDLTRLVPERGVPIGSLLLLFYPRRSTGVSISPRETLSAHHEQIIALDPRLPPGWTGGDVAEYLERLAGAYREDDLLSVEELSSLVAK